MEPVTLEMGRTWLDTRRLISSDYVRTFTRNHRRWSGLDILGRHGRFGTKIHS